MSREEESLDDFIRRCKENETVYPEGTTLSQVKYDGRRTVYLWDKNNRVVSVRLSKAKKMVPDLPVDRMVLDGDITVNAIWDPEIFGGSNLLIIT